MSDILIKGIEMPKNGEMKKIIIGRAPNGIDPIAIVTGDNTEFYKIIEVPAPHGRLIDADELKKNMRNYYPSIDHLCCSQHVVTKRDIDCAPTIIEAEVSEE